MPRTVLVTGAYGFIGRNAARYLARKGCRVIGLGHGKWDPEQWRQWGMAEWYPEDVAIENLIAHVGIPHGVVHCAGGSSVGYSVTHPYDDYQRTVATTAALLEFLRVHAPEAVLVYPSSVAIYGNAQRLPIAEDDPIAPISPYGVHKRMAERLCESYAQSFGLRITVIRLFSIYGNGLRKQLLWDACSKLETGDAVFAGTGTERRDWLHVDDAVELLAMGLDCASTNCTIINGGTGNGVTVAEILREIVSALGRDAAIRFTGQSREADPPAYVADITRARSLGWSPKREWQQGVREYVDWFRAGVR